MKKNRKKILSSLSYRRDCTHEFSEPTKPDSTQNLLATLIVLVALRMPWSSCCYIQSPNRWSRMTLAFKQVCKVLTKWRGTFWHTTIFFHLEDCFIRETEAVLMKIKSRGEVMKGNTPVRPELDQIRLTNGQTNRTCLNPRWAQFVWEDCFRNQVGWILQLGAPHHWLLTTVRRQW